MAQVSQNYPNPFNPSTKINFELPQSGNVKILVYDMSGKEVAVLLDEVKTAGFYTVTFDGFNLSSGIYYYRINADVNGNIFTDTKKMMLIK